MTRAASGLPGLRRLDHIGFTVPDLDEAPRFLVDVLGCEYLYSLGPFRDDDGDWMSEHLNVHPRAVMRRTASSAAAARRSSRCSSTPPPTSA